MKVWPLAVIGLLCLPALGCRTDPAITLLERDNRLLEDEIYRLREHIEDLESGMITADNTSATSKSSRRSSRNEESDSTSTRDKANNLPPGATTDPPAVEMPTTSQSEVPEIFKRPAGTRKPPTESKPTPVDPQKAKQGPHVAPGSESLGPTLGGSNEIDSPANGVPVEDISYSPPPKGDNYQAVQIVLHDNLCVADEKRGLRIVFEPRDRQDRHVDASADVSIGLIDPALPMPEGRIARWDYSADVVGSMFRKINGNKAIVIEAPWYEKPPIKKDLRLFVRYTTRDGRKLDADIPVVIQQPQDRTTQIKPILREPALLSANPHLTPVKEEPTAETVPQSETPVDMASLPTELRREPLRTATRDSSPSRLQRPVWTPDRR